MTFDNEAERNGKAQPTMGIGRSNVSDPSVDLLSSKRKANIANPAEHL